jgi:hypothetical protein
MLPTVGELGVRARLSQNLGSMAVADHPKLLDWGQITGLPVLVATLSQYSNIGPVFNWGTSAPTSPSVTVCESALSDIHSYRPLDTPLDRL